MDCNARAGAAVICFEDEDEEEAGGWRLGGIFGGDGQVVVDRVMGGWMLSMRAVEQEVEVGTRMIGGGVGGFQVVRELYDASLIWNNTFPILRYTMVFASMLSPRIICSPSVIT